MFSALGGFGTGKMATSGSHMTLQLMDMLLTPPAAYVLRENTWQVEIKDPYLPVISQLIPRISIELSGQCTGRPSELFETS